MNTPAEGLLSDKNVLFLPRSDLIGVTPFGGHNGHRKHSTDNHLDILDCTVSGVSPRRRKSARSQGQKQTKRD